MRFDVLAYKNITTRNNRIYKNLIRPVGVSTSTWLTKSRYIISLIYPEFETQTAMGSGNILVS